MRNFGIEILRMILCFWVVLFHCLRKSESYIIINFKRKMFHVPSFFFISFYFLFPVIKERNIKKMKLRLERLTIPYLFWPVIIWCLNNIFQLFLKKSLYGYFIPLIQLEKQIIVGRVFCGHLWFLFNLLIFTIIFFILIIVLKLNNFLKVIQLFSIISYILQYSKYNYYFFDKYKDSVSHSVGHFVESFPIAISAFFVKYSDIINKIFKWRKIVIFYSFLFNYFIYKYGIFKFIETYGKTYNYNGFDKNFFAIFSFISFYLIPFEKIQSDKLKTFIIIISNYTQGIYYIHPIIISYTTKYLYLNRTFKGCIIVYIISYLFSFIGSKLCYKSKLKYLFI